MAKMSLKMRNKINHPNHYSWMVDAIGVEPYQICGLFGFHRGNALKYLFRAGRKSEAGYDDKAKTIEDLEKAKQYIDFELESLRK